MSSFDQVLIHRVIPSRVQTGLNVRLFSMSNTVFIPHGTGVNVSYDFLVAGIMTTIIDARCVKLMNSPVNTIDAQISVSGYLVTVPYSGSMSKGVIGLSRPVWCGFLSSLQITINNDEGVDLNYHWCVSGWKVNT